MRRYFLLLLFCPTIVLAQDINTDFQAFRKDMLGNYNGFRKGVLDDYANYLNGIWNEFQVFRGRKRSETPKPTNIPKAKEEPFKQTPQTLPIPKLKPMDKPVKSGVSPKPTISPLPASIPTINFTYYGMTLNAVSIKPNRLASIEHSIISKVWQTYQQDENIKEAVTRLKQLIMAYGLNDWFSFELVRKYVAQILNSATSSDKMVLQHYLLVNLGYDVRLASTKSQLLLLVPFKQQVYERNFLLIDGQKYYTFNDGTSLQSISSIYTYDIPRNINQGKYLDLLINKDGLGISTAEQHLYNLTDGRINVGGTINKGTMEAIRHYPQMDIPYYAMSNVVPSFHESILQQIKPQIVGLSQQEAANVLLHFIQYAFDYATDRELHGYEKPYFIEENFYYSKNDCEDRAILYAFLVHNLLGLDVHLIQYPGHECTAVHFTNSNIVGDGYTYNGKSYLICDPTYIGASIGQCMPNYKNVKPKIELWY